MLAECKLAVQCVRRREGDLPKHRIQSDCIHMTSAEALFYLVGGHTQLAPIRRPILGERGGKVLREQQNFARDFVLCGGQD